REAELPAVRSHAEAWERGAERTRGRCKIGSVGRVTSYGPAIVLGVAAGAAVTIAALSANGTCTGAWPCGRTSRCRPRQRRRRSSHRACCARLLRIVYRL